MKLCHACGREWVSEKKQPGPKEYCEGCAAYLHACVNCRFHAPSAHNQCKIPNTDWVGDRSGPNFCDEFEFRDADPDSDESRAHKRALDALGELFGGEAEEKKPASFDDLFG